MTSAVVAAWEEDDTGLDAVVTALDRLRRDEGASGTRAAVVNLVVLAAVDAAADRVVHSVTGLGAHHPGRTTVIVADPGGKTAGFDARVELRRSDGEDDAGSRALWWEVVVIHVRGEVCRHLESVVDPLLMHDLPMALWLAGGTSRVDSSGLMAVANQVIVSGERAASGRDDLVGLASDLAGLAQRRPLTDLAWLALTPGRLALARLFECAGADGRIVAESVEVEGPPWSSRLFAAWLVERGLTTAAAVSSSRPGADAEGRLRAVLRVPAGPVAVDAGWVWPAGSVSGSQDQEVSAQAEARLGGLRIAVPSPGARTSQLLTGALTRFGRDLRYESALSVAAEWDT